MIKVTAKMFKEYFKDEYEKFEAFNFVKSQMRCKAI